MRSLQHHIITYLSLSLVAGCGAWLGNPKEFEDDKEKKSAAEPKVAMNLTASGLDDQALPVKDQNGQAQAELQVSELTLTIDRLSLRADDGAAQASWPADSSWQPFTDTSLKLAPVTTTVSAAHELNLAITAIKIVGTYGEQNWTIDLNTQDTAFSRTLAEPLSLTGNEQTLMTQLDFAGWFDFTGGNIDLSSQTGSQITINDEASDTAAQLKEQLLYQINRSLAFGLDQNEDGTLADAEEQSLEPVAEPEIPETGDDDSSPEPDEEESDDETSSDSGEEEDSDDE
jgi:hypothetical protein